MTASALIENELALPIRNGAFVAVVGPSGAGKDTLIAYAGERLRNEPGVAFVRRVITRPCDGVSEDHDTLIVAAFDEACARGAFAVAWEAHGLKYGLPAEVDRQVEMGHVAVANVSRGTIATLRLRYANVAVVEITAAPEILAARIAGRGRETDGDVLARLARAVPAEGRGGVTVLDNSGEKSVAGDALVAIILRAMAAADVAGLV